MNPNYTDEDARAEAAADYMAMCAIIEADDKLSAAVAELRAERERYRALERLYADKSGEVSGMTATAARWMRKAKAASKCPACKAGLEAE